MIDYKDVEYIPRVPVYDEKGNLVEYVPAVDFIEAMQEREDRYNERDKDATSS